MKALKIILAIIVLACIVFLVWIGTPSIKGAGEYEDAQNEYERDIKKEIDTMVKMPENAFCRDYYEKIVYHIEDAHNNRYLDTTDEGNEEKYKTLLLNANGKYTNKFKAQAFYVFNGSEWNIDKLNFIRNEVNRIRVEPGSSSDSSFRVIRTILAKHDEIAAHIADCNNFTWDNYSLESTGFPKEYVEGKIVQTRAYLNNNLDNRYVNKCARLKESLMATPKNLFDIHTGYLEVLINVNNNSNILNEIKSKNEGNQLYIKKIYNPLKDEWNKINNEVYRVNEDYYNTSKDMLYSRIDNALRDYSK